MTYSWQSVDGGKTITFHLHQDRQWRSAIVLHRCYVHQGAHAEKRKKVGLAMPTLVMDASAYLLLYRFDDHHARWHTRWIFVTGWTAIPHICSTHARMDAVGLDLSDYPHTRSR